MEADCEVKRKMRTHVIWLWIVIIQVCCNSYLLMASGSDNESIPDDEVNDFDANMAKYNMSDLKLSYSGKPEEDLDSFVAKFKSYAALRDYTTEKTALAIVTKIVGHASVFLETIPDAEKDTIQKIHDLLKKNFEGNSWRWSVESKLLSRKQLGNESLDMYASDIMRWCRQVKKSESEQLSIFVRGLLPTLRGFVFSKEPKTFMESLDAARLGLAVQQTLNDDPVNSNVIPKEKQESVNEIHSVLESITDEISNITTKLEKMQNDSQGKEETHQTNYRPRREIICYRCGRKGHAWRRCYAKYGVDGKNLN